MEEEEKNKSNSWTVYTQYTIRFAKLQLNVGLLGNNSDDEGRSFCLSPYTTLNWDINDKQSISFQYNLQRIQPTYMNSSLIDHKPLHKVDVNYHYTYRKLQLMADANYSLSPSCRLPAFYGVYYSVDERMKFQQILLSLYARYALAPSVSVYGGGMFTRQRIDYDNARNEKSQNANCGQLSAGSDIHFTPSFCLAINGGYYFPQKTENISGTQNYFYRANLSKEFANKRWKAAIYANDFFGKKKIKSYYKDIYSPQTVMRYTLPTNEFGVSLTYRIL